MNYKKKIILTLLIVYLLSFIGFNAFAGYGIEVSIPKGPAEGTSVDLRGYINYVYLFGLGIVGAAALMYLVIGGFIYMGADTVTSKDQAKEYIQGALFGLVLALGAYLILNTINPDLLRNQAPNLTPATTGDASGEVTGGGGTSGEVTGGGGTSGGGGASGEW